MRMNETEMEKRARQALSDTPPLSPELEAGLFAAAEELLAARRHRLAEQDARSRRASQARARNRELLRALGRRLLDKVALDPQAPAAAAACAALILAFLALHPIHWGGSAHLSYRDLPEFPKVNDAPARYDAQRLAEQEKYEREVEDAHKKTSGGL